MQSISGMGHSRRFWDVRDVFAFGVIPEVPVLLGSPVIEGIGVEGMQASKREP
jgi:hypothetical protein